MGDAWVVSAPGSPEERAVRVDGRLFIGRECAGVDDAHRLLVEEAAVSRDHAEIRTSADGVHVVDRSTNGTRVNGRRIERDEWHPLADGDVLMIGSTELTLRVLEDLAVSAERQSATERAMASGRMAILVGDIVNYTTLTETRGAVAVAAAAEELWREVRPLVIEYGGTVNNYAGDAVLATWDATEDDGVAAALRCALAADVAVTARADELEVRALDGGPIRMGWAVTAGEVAVGRTSPSKLAVFGDAVNLAFRLSGIAGREGMPAVLVTNEVAPIVPPDVSLGAPADVVVKGKTGATTVRGATLLR
ncbi:MAG TPA: adenylate/guanylate cyclase domain-containing protein [Mycobacteriales bacterium]|nr:adenylate/guanylate cyclase domain-containing protein [Mycobacteriales bacterium]